MKIASLTILSFFFVCVAHAQIVRHDPQPEADSVYIVDSVDYLPDSLESIGKYAFSDSYALEEVKFGSGLKTIGDYAFLNNSLLKKAVLNEGLTELGKGAFENCYLLSEVNIPTTLTEIKESTFDYTTIKSLVLPQNIKSVGKYAFYSIYRNEHDMKAELDTFNRMIQIPVLDGEVSIKVLNPNCEIAENAFRGNYTALYGYKGSTAEKYMLQAIQTVTELLILQMQY